MKNLKRILAYLMLILSLSALLISCDMPNNGGVGEAQTNIDLYSITVTNGGRITLATGASYTLETDVPEQYAEYVEYKASNTNITVTEDGVVTAVSEGKATVTVTCGDKAKDVVMFEIHEGTSETPPTDGNGNENGNGNGDTDGGEIDLTSDPYENMSADEFYRNTPTHTSVPSITLCREVLPFPSLLPRYQAISPNKTVCSFATPR